MNGQESRKGSQTYLLRKVYQNYSYCREKYKYQKINNLCVNRGSLLSCFPPCSFTLLLSREGQKKQQLFSLCFDSSSQNPKYSSLWYDFSAPFFCLVRSIICYFVCFSEACFAALELPFDPHSMLFLLRFCFNEGALVVSSLLILSFFAALISIALIMEISLL